MLVIGLMSGTSADGVDAALVEWPDAGPPRPFRLLGFHSMPFSDALQQRIHRVAAGHLPSEAPLRELAELDVVLGEHFAEAALAVARAAGVGPERVRAVASHGQTVGHFPEVAASLQVGNPSVIAERTGWTVVADFRPRDLAAGGEGAPLAPFFHWASLRDAEGSESRVALNLGGIANVTWLPASDDPEAVIAFDVGPANALIDGVVLRWTDGAERLDRDGARARRGHVDEALLAELMDDDYLRRPPPKSTGRERYGTREADALVERWRGAGRELDDLVATLTAFTARSVADACGRWLVAEGEAPSAPDALLVGGGGAANPAMMDALAREMPRTRVDRFDALGVPTQAAEAMAFSLLGRNALLGEPNHLPRTTGAKHERVLGVVVPGSSGRV